MKQQRKRSEVVKLVEVCKVCGLPKDICVCGAMAREAAKVKVYAVKRSFGKWVTVVEGVSEGTKELTKKLKTKLAAGGTFKEGKIEVQGEHKEKVRKILLESGFSPDQIEVG